MAVFSGFRPFLNRGSTVNGVQNLFFADGTPGAHYIPNNTSVYSSSSAAVFNQSVSGILDQKNGGIVSEQDLAVSYVAGAGTIPTNLAPNTYIARRNSDSTQQWWIICPSAVVGRWYRVSLRIADAGLGEAIRISIETQAGRTLIGTTAGDYTIIVQANATGPLRIIGDTANNSALISNITIREVSGIPSRQTSASLFPLLGRAPKIKRNTFTWTEDVSNSVWAKSLISDYTMGQPDPFGGTGAIKFKPTFITDPGGSARSASLYQGTIGYVTNVRYSIYFKPIKAISRYPSPPDATEANSDVFVQIRNEGNGSIFFNLNTMTSTLAASTIISSGIINVGNGWYRVWYTAKGTSNGNGNTWISFANRANNSNPNFDPYPSGTEEIDFYGPMFEADIKDVNSPPSTYQKVTTSVDTTEINSITYPFIRFDLSDDRLDTVLPQAVSGSIIIAGRNGTVIEPISYTANTTFQLGPTTYTGGTPGLLRAVGDVLGYSLIGKSMSDADKFQLVQYYKARGAKGILVEGPETFNYGTSWMGDFTIAASNNLFFVSGPTAAVSINNSSGTLTVTQDAGLYYGHTGILLNSDRKLVAGKAYKAVIRILSTTVSGWGSVAVFGSYSDGSTLGSAPLITSASPYTLSFIFISAGEIHEQLRLYVGGPAGSTVYDSVSIKQLRPEEDQ